MDNIQYDPERILNGLPEDILKELAKKLKRRIRFTKNDIIQEILSPPKGKPEIRVKVWQEINRQLRKELETFSEEVSMMFSAVDVPIEERFKVGYMFTLSSNPEIRAMGEALYCQAEKNKELNKEEAVALIAEITAEIEAREEKEIIEARVAEETIEAREAEEMIAAREAEEMTAAGEAEEMIAARETEEMTEAGEAEEMTEAREAEEMTEAREVPETTEVSEAEEMTEARQVPATTEVGEAEEAIEVSESKETMEIRQAEETLEVTSGSKMPSEEQMIEETEELQKRIRTLENKLRKAFAEALRTKGQLEKLKIDMVSLKSQWVREKEETGKYRNRVRELEGEREEKEKEIDVLKQKLEQRKTLIPQKTKEPLQRRELQKVKGESGEIDLALYQGRKALIFAERDNDIDIRLNALGIIPIWAMEIDWNRPRRRMSTCEVVLYKMNDKKLKKLDEIRDIARYWNIPCNELLNI